MVITKARQARRVAFAMGRELGQWGVTNRAADPMLATPDRPGPYSPACQPEGALAVILPWLSAIAHIRNTVSCIMRPETP